MGVRIWFCTCLLAYCVPLTSSYQGKLLYFNYTSLLEFDVDTRIATVLVHHGSRPVYSMDYDYKNRFMYFADYKSQNIIRFAYPSNNIKLQTVVQSISEPVGLAVDSVNDHIYWIGHLTHRLYRCNLDGSNLTLLSTPRYPIVIRLDVTNRWIYIVEQKNGILKYRFDLSEHMTIVNFVSPYVECMDIDTNDEKLYWINIDGDMKSSNDDGSDVKTFLSTNEGTNYYTVSVVGSYIYYFNENNQLMMVNKIPGSTPTLLYNETSKIYSIFVFNTLGMLITIYNHV